MKAEEAAPQKFDFKALWADKQKRVMLVFGGGAALVLLICLVALGISGGGDSDKIKVEKMGFEAANGKDISKSARWFSRPMEMYTPYDAAMYYAGEETAVWLIEDDDEYALLDKDWNIVLECERLRYIGDAKGEPMFYARVEALNDPGTVSFEGVINAKGEGIADFEALNIWPDSVYSYSEDLLMVMENSRYTGKTRYGAIDAEGQLVIPYQMEYDWVFGTTFVNGYAVTQLHQGQGVANYRYGLVNNRGEEVIPCEYDSMTLVCDNKVIAQKDGQYGALHTDGSEALPFTYANAGAVADALGWEFFNGRYYKAEDVPKGVEFQMDTPETPDGNEILMIASCAYEPGLFQVWTEGGYSSNSSQLYDTYFCDWEGRQRTPLFQAYGVEDEDNCFATPIIGWDGAIGMLPQLLTDEEQAEFLQLIGEE